MLFSVGVTLLMIFTELQFYEATKRRAALFTFIYTNEQNIVCTDYLSQF